MASRGIFATFPGSLGYQFVEDGEAVDEGQKLFAVECMKVMNEIKSPAVGKIVYKKELGEYVEVGDLIAVIES